MVAVGAGVGDHPELKHRQGAVLSGPALIPMENTIDGPRIWMINQEGYGLDQLAFTML
ncbi:hypothetical protein ACFW1M_36425 [Streptomyces inhibens]|uniref:hypothetical protein n=1 Tax=Streptomyces inhibens TaxID=2293571 RepID=UPI0036989EF2